MCGTRRVSATQQARQATRHAASVRHVVEEACNKGDLAVLDALLASASGVDAARRLSLRQGLAEFRAAVPDARWTIVEQIAVGDTVVTRLAVQGTFCGPLVGLAPPGRPATLSGVAIGHFAQGRLIDLWLQADLLGLLQQLGVMPPLALDKAVAVARVLHARAKLAEEPSPPRSPPCVGRSGRGAF
jgi:predicted ester cyclase